MEENESKIVQWLNKPLTYESRKGAFMISATIGALFTLALFTAIIIYSTAK